MGVDRHIAHSPHGGFIGVDDVEEHEGFQRLPEIGWTH
jgi:hypothetical protein